MKEIPPTGNLDVTPSMTVAVLIRTGNILLLPDSVGLVVA